MVNKRILNPVLGCNLKNDNPCSFSRQTIQYHSNPSPCPNWRSWSNAEEAEVEWSYEDLEDLLELKPQKAVLFIIGDWNAKVGSQETRGVTGKFSLGVQNEAGQRLIESCQENALFIAKTLFQQHERTLHMEVTRWPILTSNWLYFLQPKMEKLYTVSRNKTRSWLWLRSWIPYCQIQT